MFSLPVVSREAARPRIARRLSVEVLELRNLFSISPGVEDSDEPFLSHGGACTCPICSGTIAFSPEMRAPAAASDLAKASLSSLPQLSSLPGSQFTLFLDFDGGYTTGWESYAVYTPAYDFDNDVNSFSTSELNSIRDIWARVAEDYSAFNINVTTVDPGNLTNGRTAKIAIGGDYTDWFGESAGGVAYVGGFYNSASNVGFVFSDALANGVARYVAEATSHEAGHLFGLWHQSSYNSSGGKTAEYSTGNSAWAPIMGVGYYATVTTWYNGPNNLGPNSLQDDMSVLSNGSNGFGYRADEAGDNASSTARLTLSGNTVSGNGIIGRNTDADYYRFTTTGGNVSLSANTIGAGANLDVVLELRRADGSIVSSVAPTNSLNATISANLAAGDYFLVVRSTGVYGYVGQYALAGTLPAGSTSGDGGGSTGGNTGGSTGGNTGNNTSGNNNGGATNNNNNNTPSAPEIRVTENGANIVDNTGVVAYGTVQKGAALSKTFTVTNDGTANLNLTKLKDSQMPKGFNLVRGFTDLILSPGESTTFIVSISKNKGAYNGFVSFVSNDADERPFNFRVTGSVTKTGVAGTTTTDISAAGSFDVATGLQLTRSQAGNGAIALVERIESRLSDLIHAESGRGVVASAKNAQEAVREFNSSLRGVAESSGSSANDCLDDVFSSVEDLFEDLLAA